MVYKCQNNGMPPSQAAGGSGPVWNNEMCSCPRDYRLFTSWFWTHWRTALTAAASRYCAQDPAASEVNGEPIESPLESPLASRHYCIVGFQRAHRLKSVGQPISVFPVPVLVSCLHVFHMLEETFP